MSIGFWTIIFFVILTSPHWILIQSICVIIHITLQSKALLETAVVRHKQRQQVEIQHVLVFWLLSYLYWEAK